MRSLTGKVAVVTGAGRGIGRAIGVALNRAGARRAGGAGAAELRAVAEKFAAATATLDLPTDVTRDEGWATGPADAERMRLDRYPRQ
jgi:NAD(P)-dependent dehydrogenase (short-subunit alcohol dehydrogenase family)